MSLAERIFNVGNDYDPYGISNIDKDIIVYSINKQLLEREVDSLIEWLQEICKEACGENCAEKAKALIDEVKLFTKEER